MALVKSRKRLQAKKSSSRKAESGNSKNAKDETDDLDRYIASRKKTDKAFAKEFDEGYSNFKIGVILKQAREAAGMTQDQIAKRLLTNKSAISRIENHADDIRLSTLTKYAEALGKRLRFDIASA